MTTSLAAASPPDAYAALLPAAIRAVREQVSRYHSAFHWTERHLQCVWFDERLRPARLVTRDGETVQVDSPGRWNLEAGPDFLDAKLRLGAEQRRIDGDVELHVRPADWDRHHHDRAGLYRNVVLHVTYYAGPAAQAETTAGIAQLALCDALSSIPAFSFDDIDLAAYPHAVLPLTPRPCSLALRETPARWEPLLRAAGRHRLGLKVERMRMRLARLPDREQVLYEEILAALGYAHNAGVFRRLAQHLPLAAWDAGAPVETCCASLLGAMGLLPDIEAAGDEEAQRFVRHLWDNWWRHPVALPDGESFAVVRHGTRPHNAPARRLAAAAALFCGGVRLGETLAAIPREPAARWFARVNDALASRLEFPFWRGHLTATGKRQPQPTALVGAARLSAIAANVVLPLLIAEGVADDSLAEHLPSEDISAPMRETANALFSRDHNPSLYATSGLCQQGLLQIHHDFCLTARAGCQGCAFAERLSHDPERH